MRSARVIARAAAPAQSRGAAGRAACRGCAAPIRRPQFPSDVALQAEGGPWQRAAAGAADAVSLDRDRARGRRRSSPGLRRADRVGAGARPRPHAARAIGSLTNAGAVDAGMRWLSISTRPSASAWRCRMTVSAATAQADRRARRLRRRDSARTPNASAAALAALFDAHHYSNGCAFVRPGTPTNNTEDAPSGLDSADPLRARSFEAEWQQFGQPLAFAQRRARLGVGRSASRATPHRSRSARCPRPFAPMPSTRSRWRPPCGRRPGATTSPNLVACKASASMTSTGRASTFIAHVHAAGRCLSWRRPPALWRVAGDDPPDWAAPAGAKPAHAASNCGLKAWLLQLRDRLLAAAPARRGADRAQQRPAAGPRRGAAPATASPAAIARVICSARQVSAAPACLPRRRPRRARLERGA